MLHLPTLLCALSALCTSVQGLPVQDSQHGQSPAEQGNQIGGFSQVGAREQGNQIGGFSQVGAREQGNQIGGFSQVGAREQGNQIGAIQKPDGGPLN